MGKPSLLFHGSEHRSLDRNRDKMMIEHLEINMEVTAPGVVGILTIFGRKKKDEKPVDTGQLDTVSNESGHADSPVQSNQATPQPDISQAKDILQSRDIPPAGNIP